MRAEYSQRPRKTAWGPRRRVGQDEPWEQRKTEARILQRVRWVRRPHGAQGEEEEDRHCGSRALEVGRGWVGGASPF